MSAEVLHLCDHDTGQYVDSFTIDYEYIHQQAHERFVAAEERHAAFLAGQAERERTRALHELAARPHRAAARAKYCGAGAGL